MSKLELFEQIRDKFLELTTPETFNKEVSFAFQHIKGNSQLEKATKESKLKSVLNIAQIGLTLNPVAKEAFLVPRFNSYKDSDGRWSKVVECCLEPSYVGLTKLLTDAGSVTSINTQIVYKGDDFDMDLAQATVKHRPYYLTGNDKGDIIGVYSIARLKTGENQIEFMTIDSVNDIRDISESYKAFKGGKIKSCIWESNYTEMIRKTIIRRIYKYLPRTERMEQVDRAIDLDNQDYKPTLQKINFIESLLNSCTLPPSEIKAIEDEIDIMNNKRASGVITYLKDNQKGLRDGVVNTQTIQQELDLKC